MTSKGCGRFVEVWGPCAWKFMHAVAATAPASGAELDVYVVFFRAIGHVLPCPHCRSHYLQFLTEHPLAEYLQDSANHAPPNIAGAYGNVALQRWVHILHNDVNLRTNKKKLTFEQSISLVHNACAARITPVDLADPFYGGGAAWMTTNQQQRLAGETVTGKPTGSFHGNTALGLAIVVSAIVLGAVYFQIKDRPNYRHRSTAAAGGTAQTS